MDIYKMVNFLTNSANHLNFLAITVGFRPSLSMKPPLLLKVLIEDADLKAYRNWLSLSYIQALFVDIINPVI